MVADTSYQSDMSAAQQELFMKEASNAGNQARINLDPDLQVRSGQTLAQLNGSLYQSATGQVCFLLDANFQAPIKMNGSFFTNASVYFCAYPLHLNGCSGYCCALGDRRRDSAELSAGGFGSRRVRRRGGGRHHWAARVRNYAYSDGTYKYMAPRFRGRQYCFTGTCMRGQQYQQYFLTVLGVGLRSVDAKIEESCRL